MTDPHVEYVLAVLGYAVASHVMSRATLSPSRTGAYEEVLTADLSDIFVQFDVSSEYLKAQGSASTVTVEVRDLPKAIEAQLGADFILATDASDHTVWPIESVRKVIFIQAKRQDFGASNLAYATSKNHVAKAKAMQAVVGLANSYFAYYHDSFALNALPKSQSFSWPGGSQPPFFYYHNPKPGSSYYLAPHPVLKTNEFIEPSGYRSWTFMRDGGATLPDYEWGVGLLGAEYFIDAAGKTRNKDLPPVAHVLSNGTCLPQFILDLAGCRSGDNLTQVQFADKIKRGEDLATKAATSLEVRSDWFSPRFMVIIRVEQRSASSEEA